MPRGRRAESVVAEVEQESHGNTVQGTVIEYLGQNTGKSGRKSWVRHDFTLQLPIGGAPVKCSVFGDFNPGIVGEDVEFEAEYNEKYRNYAVKGDITVVNSGDSKPATHTAAVQAQTTTARKSTVSTDLDAVREAAQAVFTQDAEFVNRTLGGNPSDEALAIGIQALQAIRATLFIESNRRASGR